MYFLYLDNYRPVKMSLADSSFTPAISIVGNTPR
jgi:hypothetical protein